MAPGPLVEHLCICVWWGWGQHIERKQNTCCLMAFVKNKTQIHPKQSTEEKNSIPGGPSNRRNQKTLSLGPSNRQKQKKTLSLGARKQNKHKEKKTTIPGALQSTRRKKTIPGGPSWSKKRSHLPPHFYLGGLGKTYPKVKWGTIVFVFESSSL